MFPYPSLSQGENKEVTWGLLGGSVIENYFEDAEEEKFRFTSEIHLFEKLFFFYNNVNAFLFRHIAEQAVKHKEADTVPSG